MMRIVSISELITGVAAMQCVDRGLEGLDDDVAHVTPELADFNGDKPILRDPEPKITMRRLLSHSSGFCHDPLSRLLGK